MNFLTLFLIVLVIYPLTIRSQSATEIVRIADQKMRGNTSQADMVIRIIRPSWSREMELRVWMAHRDYVLILIQSPARDKGIAFLKRGKEIWNWIPVLERTIKLPPSMMSQSWMGTDFTNDDLVKESSAVEDYNHRFIGDTIIDTRPCHKIEFIPKPEAAVVWGKLLVCIDKKDFIELYTGFYDEDGKLVNRMIASDIKTMDGRLIPTRFYMYPVEKKNQRTEMIYKSLIFDRPIDATTFSVDRMKRLD